MKLFNPRSDLVIDLFLVVLVALLPLLLIAVGQVRRGRLRAHASLMTSGFFLFLAAVLAFEIRVRTADLPAPALLPFLVHLGFAVPCLALWVAQISSGRRAHENPARHRRRGRSVIALYSLTVATGVWLYLATF